MGGNLRQLPWPLFPLFPRHSFVYVRLARIWPSAPGVPVAFLPCSVHPLALSFPRFPFREMIFHMRAPLLAEESCCDSLGFDDAASNPPFFRPLLFLDLPCDANRTVWKVKQASRDRLLISLFFPAPSHFSTLCGSAGYVRGPYGQYRWNIHDARNFPFPLSLEFPPCWSLLQSRRRMRAIRWSAPFFPLSFRAFPPPLKPILRVSRARRVRAVFSPILPGFFFSAFFPKVLDKARVLAPDESSFFPSFTCILSFNFRNRDVPFRCRLMVSLFPSFSSLAFCSDSEPEREG